MEPVLKALEYLREMKCVNEGVRQLRDKFIEKMSSYAAYCGYDLYKRRGYQIGSGAMESLHRQASQQRTKVPGVVWTPQNCLGVVKLRLLQLVGRWDEFWAQPDLVHHLHDAFSYRQRDVELFLEAA